MASIPYNGLKTFLIAKENTLKIGQVGVGSNIAQNHSSSIQRVLLFARIHMKS